MGHPVISKAGHAVINKSKVLGSFKKGGKVKKTGNYKLHKGEKVVPKKKNKKDFNAGKFETAKRKVFGMGRKKN